MFIPAFLFKTDKLTDFSYSLTFIFLTLFAFFSKQIHLRNIIITIMIVLWALRLGIFLLIRIFKSKKDRRFDGIRESFLKFLQFWVLQGISVWIILIPTLFFFLSDYNNVYWSGLFIWAFGLSFEAISDYQKYQFKQKSKNKGDFINTGLWRYSRHPNYFGEILCWVGIYIFVFPTLTILESFIGLISPIYIASLIIFFTGIPKLEKYADKKWGNRRKYQEYKKRTNKLIPWIPKENNEK
ncbi:MAG: DUF1295 domain-containing protein [Candidatus Woesearchaeota archaeon]